MDVGKISLVVAAYNAVAMLRESLPANVKAGFAAIIVIDGESTDTTADEVRLLQARYPGIIHFFQTPRRGLANARNSGTSKVGTDIVMHAGPDNIMTRATVESMLGGIAQFDLVSCQTRRVSVRGYMGRAHDIYKKRYAPGPQMVVGTPYLGRTELFRAFPFNEKMLNSDDTELCQRLTDAGRRILRSEAVCQEIGFEGFEDIVERWTRWGRGDALFYRSQVARWTLGRKMRSWAHPFKAEIIDCARSMSPVEFMYILPFVLMVMGLRYFGWVRYVLLGRKK